MAKSREGEFRYIVGGTLAPDAPSYVERQADKDLLASLEQGETCYVLNSRQMGKSSLCVRTIVGLKAAGVRTAFCDLTKFGGRNVTAEQWYAALLSEIGRELGLRNEFLAYWKESAALPPVQRLFGAITELGLKDSSLVVFFDEIDVTLSLPFSADEFFAAIRQCYVGRVTDERLRKVCFCLLGTATPADLIQDTRVSPFNIGKRIELSDFTEGEAMALAAGLGDPALLKRVLHWTGGHPYLTQRLCQAVRDSGSKDVDKVCSDLFLTHAAKDSDDNLAFVRNRLLKSEADLPALLDLYRKLRSGRHVQDDDTNPLYALLKLSGVARVESGALKVRNRIYEHVFDHDWVETHMPDAEKRRQKEAYRKGILRTLAFAAVVVLVVASLAVFGFVSAQRATRLTAEIERNLYFARMNNLQIFSEEGNETMMAEILEQTRKSPYRGWEWGYWNKQLHFTTEEYALDSPDRDAVISSARFSLDGSQIAIVDKTLQAAFIIDRKSKSCVGRYHVDPSEGVVSTKTGWVIYDWKPKCRIRELSTGRTLRTFDLADSSYRLVTLYPKANLVSTYELLPSSPISTRLRLWNLTTGKQVWQLNKRDGYAIDCGVSGDGSIIFLQTGNNDDNSIASFQAIRLQDNWIVDQFTGQNGLSPSLSPSGKYVVVEIANKLVVRNISEHRNVIESRDWVVGTFDASEHLLTSDQTNSAGIAVRNIPSGQVIARYPGTTLALDQCEATGDFMTFGSTSVRVVPRAKEEQPYIGMTDIHLMRDFKNQITAIDGLTGESLILAEPQLKIVEKRKMDQSWQTGSASSRWGIYHESVAKQSRFLLKDRATGKIVVACAMEMSRCAGDTEGKLVVALSSGSRLLDCYDAVSRLKVWKHQFPTAQDDVQVSANGSRVFVCSGTTVLLLDGKSGQILKTIDLAGAGKTVSAGFIGTTTDFWVSAPIRTTIFEGESGQELLRLATGDQLCSTLDLSPDQSRIAVGSASGLLLFDRQTRTRVLNIHANGLFCTGLFTKDGRKILVGSQGGSLQVLESDDRDPTVKISVGEPIASKTEPRASQPGGP